MANHRVSANLIKIFSQNGVLTEAREIETYSANLYGVTRKIRAVVFPKNVSEIQKLVELANRKRIPLYPVSTGKNWGLGSNLPTEPGHIVVDFRQMNRILRFDKKFGTITIEPGATQEKIAHYLKKRRAPFFLNVTGSTKDSSVIGNALERGVAHYGCRVPEIMGFNVILGTGEELKVGGLSVAHSRCKDIYPYGLGPDLRGLFFQSAFGIITSATLRLRPIAAHTAVVTIESSRSLSVFIDRLQQLRNQGVLPSNLHISNRDRRLSVVSPLLAREFGTSISEASKIANQFIKTDFAATCSLNGSRPDILAALRKINHYLRDVAKVSILFDSDLKKPAIGMKGVIRKATQGAFLHACGVPSNAAIPSLGFGQNEMIQDNPVASNTGTLFVVPILPFTGMDTRKVLSLTNRMFSKYGFRAFVTFNLVEDLNLEAVINLTFDRRDRKRVSLAHKCATEAAKLLSESGYPPQRMSIFQMAHLGTMDTCHQRAVQGLKNLFDPNSIIARGRYTPTRGRE